MVSNAPSHRLSTHPGQTSVRVAGNLPARSGLPLEPPTDPTVVRLIDEAKVRIAGIRENLREL
ncbi:MAG: hypothetical protein U0R17_02450 [Acidimicrobiia bacterium]